MAAPKSRQIEFRAAPLIDAPATGRRLVGTALRYNTVARINHQFDELFAEGALRTEGAICLNWEHDELRSVAPRGAVDVTETAGELRMMAECSDTPLADMALDQVRRKCMGLSIEFVPIAEHRDTRGVRVLTDAILMGLAVTARPAHPTTVEARRAPPPRRWRYYR